MPASSANWRNDFATAGDIGTPSRILLVRALASGSPGTKMLS